MLRNCVLALCFAAGLCAQDAPPPDNPAVPATPAAPGAAAAARPPATDPQPYEKVITKDAKSTPGIFTVHEIKDRYYYEIPKAQLGREFLMNVRISKTTMGVGYGGEELTDGGWSARCRHGSFPIASTSRRRWRGIQGRTTCG